MFRWIFVIVLVVLLVFVFSSCDDDDDETYLNFLLTGDYYLGSYLFDTPGGGGNVSQTGVLGFDGINAFNGTVTSNSDGTIVPSPGSGTYLVSESRFFSIFPASGPSRLDGGILLDGSMGIVTSVVSGNPPLMGLAIKKSGTFTTGSVTGDYFLCTFQYNLGVSRRFVTTGIINSDGVGGYTTPSNLTVNDEGSISTISDTGTYVLLTDGSLTVTNGSAQVMEGGVKEGNGVIGFGKTSPGGPPEFGVMIKRAGVFSTADLVGDYFFSVFGYDNISSGLNFCSKGIATFDGAGNWIFNALDNTEGTISTSGETGTYSVAADGAVTMTTSGGDVLSGGMLLGGDIAAVVSTSAASIPIFAIGLKR